MWTDQSEIGRGVSFGVLGVAIVGLVVWPAGRRSHRGLDGAVVLADVVHDARDTERPGEAQQVGQEAEGDAEDEGPPEGLPQGPPDLLGPQGDGALGPLGGDERGSKDGRRTRRS